MSGSRFHDRRQAGRLLAERLGAYRRAPATVVLGLPRGGMVPAAEIAGILELPLDVLLSRKLRAPGNPELAIGAVAEDGEPYLDERSCAATGASDAWIARETAEQKEEIERRRRLLHGGAAVALPPESTVILVDDGIATGSTAVAAIRALRRQGVGRIVLATPVAPPDTTERLRAEVDDLVVLKTPEPFWSVGGFYEDFEQVSDEEVRLLLDEARNRRRPVHPGGATTPS